MSQPSKNIPKFTSFRTKTPASGQPSSSTSLKREPSPERRHRSNKRHKSPDSQPPKSHRHHDSHKHASRQRHTNRSPRDHHERSHSRGPVLTKEPSLTHHHDDSHLFVSDRKGDYQNVTYQSLHKYSIPPYHRIGCGNILGLESRFKIDRVESTDHKVYIIDKSATSKDRPQRLLLKRQKFHELPMLRAQEDDLDVDEDFVVLEPSTDNRRNSRSSNEESDLFKDISRPQYQESHAPSTYETPKLSSDVDFEARQQNAQLYRATKAEPTDLQAWLDLASHQQYLVRPGVDAHALTNSERQALADMRIAVYEKALKHFPPARASEHELLILGLLHEASLAWDAQRYMQKLEVILQQHPASFSIWNQYLNACQANPIDFRVENVKGFFIRCLHSIATIKSTNHEPETQNMMLYLILRYTVLLLDTGYDELSIAIWQALFEYHFLKPECLVNSEDGHVLAQFEEFWESEATRFGEVGSQGWRVAQDNAVIPEASHPEHEGKLATKLPFRTFSALENNESKSYRFPGRTMDENGVEDPFHVVFFSDIKSVLEPSIDGFERREFIDAFLQFLGLPSICPSTNDGSSPKRREWRFDIFLDHGLLQRNCFHRDSNDADEQHVQQYQISTDLLFSRAFGRASTSTPPTDDAPNKSPEEKSIYFAKRTLSTLVQLFSDDEILAEYYLAFELYYFPEKASKVAKDILRKRPSSLRLYNACAMIEAKSGKLEKASQIWSSTIQMKDNFSVAAQEEIVLLWRNWIRCDLEADRPQMAISHLMSYGHSTDLQNNAITGVSISSMLRLRKALKDGFDHSITQSQPHLAALNAEMLALAAYLTEPDALQSSMDVIEDHCNTVLKRSSKSHVLLELLHQIKASIMAHHIQKNRPYKPAFVRVELEASIALFPNNTIFLEMYRDNEVRFRIDDRVRSILKNQVLTDGQSPVVAWMFAINQELSRFTSQSSGSTAESVRATFNRALLTTGSPVRHSKTLWMRWFVFELQVAGMKMLEGHSTRKRFTPDQQPLQKPKEVFLSGLHHLPWSKDWILQGLEVFDRDDGLGWDTRDLRRLYNVLVERELRIRVEGLEDVLDKDR